MSDDNELEWYHLSACQGMKINWFFDEYENDDVLRRNVDSICAACPVQAACLREGIENNETGVWGGVYLIKGRMDTVKNSHKSEEDWKQIRKMIVS